MLLSEVHINSSPFILQSSWRHSSLQWHINSQFLKEFGGFMFICSRGKEWNLHFRQTRLLQLCHHGNSNRLQKYHLSLCSYGQVVHSENTNYTVSTYVMKHFTLQTVFISPSYLCRPDVDTFIKTTRRQKFAIRRECHTVYWLCVLGERVNTSAMIDIPQSNSGVKRSTANNSRAYWTHYCNNIH